MRIIEVIEMGKVWVEPSGERVKWKYRMIICEKSARSGRAVKDRVFLLDYEEDLRQHHPSLCFELGWFCIEQIYTIRIIPMRDIRGLVHEWYQWKDSILVRNKSLHSLRIRRTHFDSINTKKKFEVSSYVRVAVHLFLHSHLPKLWRLLPISFLLLLLMSIILHTQSQKVSCVKYQSREFEGVTVGTLSRSFVSRLGWLTLGAFASSAWRVHRTWRCWRSSFLASSSIASTNQEKGSFREEGLLHTTLVCLLSRPSLSS
jgi:hypothetical protein